MINEHVIVPRRSMTGLLFLFTAPSVAGTRDSEKFVNPDITSVKIDIDGVPNMLYSRGMIPTDLYKSTLQRFTGDTSVKEKDFYTNNKFAIWIDLRTHSDNNNHGSGLALRDTRDGVKLEIHRTTGGSGTITCHIKEFKLAFNYVLGYYGTNANSVFKKICFNTKKHGRLKSSISLYYSRSNKL